MLLFLVLQFAAVLFAHSEGDPIASALCRAQCIHKLLEERAIEEKDCSTQPDCFLCWEHCGTISSNNSSQKALCNDNQCSQGCEVACKFFKEMRVPTKERLNFPSSPTMRDGVLEWAPVPNATLYSVSLVFLNRTMHNIAQTVACKLKMSRVQLSRVTGIVVVAVNDKGALGIVNYNLLRRIVKKNVSSTILKLKEVIERKGTLDFPPTHNPVIWATEGATVKLDETLVTTTISWKFINKEKYRENCEFLLKWWIPDLNMEGNTVVNSSQTTELTYLFKYICLVKVKVMGTDLESQILVLKREHHDLKTSNNNIIINSFLFGCLMIICVITLFIAKLINSWKFNECNVIEDKSIPFCNI